MKKHVISFPLSIAGIKSAIAETKAEQAGFEAKWDTFLSRIAQEGVLAAQNAITKHKAIDTETLIKSVSYERIRPGLYRIYCYAPVHTKKGIKNYAFFVEYGTGVVGAASPHPEAEAQGWTYDVNGHGEDGWFYPYSKGQHHTYKFNEKTSKMQPWSMGQPAKPFMHESRQHILDPAVYLRIAKEVFGR